MKTKDAVSIGDIYGKMLNGVKHNIQESNKNAFGDEPELVGDGPQTDGYNDALNDEKASKCGKGHKKGEKCCHEEDEETSVKKTAERKKINVEKVNSIMSKSTFESIYEKILKEQFGADDTDVDALGLDDATPDSEFDFSDEGGDEGDSITVTLDKATAQALCDVLQGALDGGDDSEDDFGDDEVGDDELDFGAEEDYEEEDDMDYEEDEETQGTTKKETSGKLSGDNKLQGKDNKVKEHPKPKGQKAKAEVTDKTDTTHGAPSFSHLQGHNNQVQGSSLKKASDYFQ